MAHEDDVAELSDFFKTISDAMPADQQDEILAYLKDELSAENLANFINDDENTLALIAAVEGRIIGGMFARYTSFDEHASVHWEDPCDHLTLLWYGVAPEARGAVYSEPRYKIASALFAFLKHYADVEFECSDIETLNHVNNTYGRKTLNDNGFINRGNVLNNLDMDKVEKLPTSQARNYERFKFSLSRRVLN